MEGADSLWALFSNGIWSLRGIQASGATSPPARALELMDSAIASLETSLGLQPGEGLVSTADGNSTQKGPVGGKKKSRRIVGAGNSSAKKGSKGQRFYIFRYHLSTERKCPRAYRKDWARGGYR